MENNNINLLDLGDDILNIIGDYVKKDIYIKKIEDISKNSIKLLNIVKKGCWKTKKPDMRNLIINYLYVNNIRDIETIDIVLTLMKLNLKQKNYPFSIFCIENYEDSKTTYDKILEQKSLLYYIDGKPYISNIKRFFH